MLGFLGTVLDQGKGQIAGSAGGRPSRSASTRTCWSHGFELLHDQRAHRARASGARRTSARSRRRPRCGRTRSTFADPWDFEEVYGALHDFARALSVRRRARGLPRPHHHRHPRRADLPVPAHRVAPLSRRGCCRRRRRANGEPTRAARYSDHRSRSLAATTASPRASRASSARACRSSRRASTRERGLQRADRADRAGRDRARARRSCSRARRAPASRSSRGASTSSSARAAGRGRVRRGELRHAARRRRDVGAVRPRAAARSPARSSDRPACCGRPTAACSSSTRSASSASTSRRCCCARSRTRRSCPSAPIGRRKSDFQLIAGTNRDLAARVAGGQLPRGPARAHQPVDFRLPALARAAGGHRAEPRLRARARPRAYSARA